MRSMPFRFDNAARPDGQREQRLALFCVGSLALLALAAYGFSVYDLWLSYAQPFLGYTLIDRDFANYWVAARLVASGDHLDLFSQATYFPQVRETFGPWTPWRNWSYPPHYLLFISWLAPLSYKAGLVAFLGSTFAFLLYAVAVFRREHAPDSDLRVVCLALFGYALMQVSVSQNGFLIAAFLLLGLAWMKRRPVLAGLAFACLTVKPQLGLLLPVLMVFDRNWATLAWSSFFTVLLVAVSSAIFGVASWSAYVGETASYQRFVMMEGDGIFPFMMPTVFGSFRALDFFAALNGFRITSDVALIAQLPMSVMAFAAVVWVLRHELDPLRRAFAVTCGTFLITPYAFNYDMGALCVCAALLAGQRAKEPRGSLFVVAVALVAAIPAAVTHLGRVGLPITPLVLTLGIGVLIAARSAIRDAAEARASASVQG
jgi:hypothetical protein